MPRYYFHLRSKDRFVWDEKGVDLPDPTTAQAAADKVAAELRGRPLHKSKVACCRTVAVTDKGDPLTHVISL
jgi:hypothetical protein